MPIFRAFKPSSGFPQLPVCKTPKFQDDSPFHLRTGDPMATLVRGRPINVDVSSEGCFEIAMQWIRKCLETHSRCPLDLENTLPTRVIDVGNPDRSKSPFLFITHGGCGRWVTLSYCWGNVTPLMTTSKNLADRCTQISLRDLPALYQDAIEITRRLGYQYLWIDSLCILQDFNADWIAESSKMGTVYRNAVLNISADASQNPDCGIFESANRNRIIEVPLLNLPCRSTMEQSEGCVAIYDGLGSAGCQSSPLQKRAWVLQENMFSPRKLHYKSDELYFSCDTTRLVRETDQGLQRYSGQKTKAHSIFQMPYVAHESGLKACGVRTETDLSEIMKLWYEKVYDYAARQISFKSDRFPAIAGLAKDVAARTGYHYKAGLWFEDIHNGLLWYAPWFGRSAGHAPTWSWAVFDVQQHSPSQLTETGMVIGSSVKQDRHLAKIIQVQVKNVDNDTFGQVESARITIEGRWRSAHWDGKLTPVLGSWDTRGRVRHMNWLIPGLQRDVLIVDPCQIIWALDDSAPASLPNFSQPRVMYMQIGKFQYNEVYGKADVRMALILEPTGSASNEYRRIGIARIPEDEGMADGWETMAVTIF
jgi:Heterokaryon incompatibility protein (HET)